MVAKNTMNTTQTLLRRQGVVPQTRPAQLQGTWFNSMVTPCFHKQYTFLQNTFTQRYISHDSTQTFIKVSLKLLQPEIY